jgi:hypothetical protein
MGEYGVKRHIWCMCTICTLAVRAADPCELQLVSSVTMWMGKAPNQPLFGDHLSLLNPQRLLVLLLVVLGHGLLIYLLTLHSGASRTESTDEFRSVALYLAPVVELKQEAPRKISVVKATSPNKPPRKENSAITLPVPQPAPSADMAQPDWAMEAEEAARRMANSVSPRKRFGKPPEE